MSQTATNDDGGPIADGNAATDGSITQASVLLASGWMHTCASIDGLVACWGLGVSGQLGQGATDSSATPVRVTLPGPATNIAAGRDHSCAIVGGNVYCWGGGAGGRLGTGSTASALVPDTAVVGPRSYCRTVADICRRWACLRS